MSDEVRKYVLCTAPHDIHSLYHPAQHIRELHASDTLCGKPVRFDFGSLDSLLGPRCLTCFKGFEGCAFKPEGRGLVARKLPAPPAAVDGAAAPTAEIASAPRLRGDVDSESPPSAAVTRIGDTGPHFLGAPDAPTALDLPGFDIECRGCKSSHIACTIQFEGRTASSMVACRDCGRWERLAVFGVPSPY